MEKDALQAITILLAQFLGTLDNLLVKDSILLRFFVFIAKKINLKVLGYFNILLTFDLVQRVLHQDTTEIFVQVM